jgi:hypothetical protein
VAGRTPTPQAVVGCFFGKVPNYAIAQRNLLLLSICKLLIVTMTNHLNTKPLEFARGASGSKPLTVCSCLECMGVWGILRVRNREIFENFSIPSLCTLKVNPGGNSNGMVQRAACLEYPR